MKIAVFKTGNLRITSFHSVARFLKETKFLTTVSAIISSFLVGSFQPNVVFAGQIQESEKKTKQQEVTDTQTLKDIVKKHSRSRFVPALVAAIAEKGKPVRKAANGLIKFGSKESVTKDHIVHLGSCTKAMTAVLVARLVDQGKLRWDMTVVEAAPHLKTVIDKSYHDLNFRELLSHQSGVAANAKNWFLEHQLPPREARLKVLKDSLSSPMKKDARGKYVYSNLGYMLAGYMAATVEKSDWEALITKEVFKPLKMNSASFGPPSTDGKMDQPWGHTVSILGKVNPGQVDNAPALGPAGTAHMKIEDWSKFGLALAIPEKEILSQIKNPKKNHPLFQFLSAKSLQEIRTYPNNKEGKRHRYALGWINMKRSWTKEPLLFHNGSNTYWYAEIWVVPEYQTCFLAVSNAGGPAPTRAVQKTISDLLKVYMKDQEKKKSK